jgi:hypothetical protein
VVVWAGDVVVLVLVVEVFTEVVRVVAGLVEVGGVLPPPPDEEPSQVKTAGPDTRRQNLCLATCRSGSKAYRE